MPDNPALLAVMREAEAHFDADVERRLIRAIADSTLLAPIVHDEAAGGWVHTGSVTATGERVLIAFTDEDAVDRWRNGQDLAVAPIAGVELAQMAEPAQAVGLAINPAGPNGGRLDRRMTDVVAAGGSLVLQGASADGDLTMRSTGGALSVRAFAGGSDPVLVDSLTQALAGEHEVQQAWLVELVEPAPPHPLLVLIGVEEPPAPVQAAVRRAVAGPDRFVDVMPISAAAWEASPLTGVLQAGVRIHPPTPETSADAEREADGRSTADGATGGLQLEPFPTDVDPGLLGELREAVLATPEIHEAWLSLMVSPGPAKPLLVLVGVDGVPHPVGQVLSPRAGTSHEVDVMPVPLERWKAQPVVEAVAVGVPLHLASEEH